jgi:hypothetical protein
MRRASWPGSTPRGSVDRRGPDRARALLVQQRHPVGRDASLRAGDRLVGWMMGRRRQCGSLHVVVRPIVVEPVLTGLEARDDRVLGAPGVLARVLLGRVVAASDMASLGTTPKVQPPAAGGVTFDTSRSAGWDRGVNRFVCHLCLPRADYRPGQKGRSPKRAWRTSVIRPSTTR